MKVKVILWINNLLLGKRRKNRLKVAILICMGKIWGNKAEMKGKMMKIVLVLKENPFKVRVIIILCNKIARIKGKLLGIENRYIFKNGNQNSKILKMINNIKYVNWTFEQNIKLI